MFDELENPNLTHQQRLEIGMSIADDDPREGVGLREDSQPDYSWCFVEGGQVEIENDHFQVADFYIAKYPVTHSQFQGFVDADDGYHNAVWWQEIPEIYKKQELVTQKQPYANHPRDGLSWYQALAFSRWANVHCKLDDAPENWIIRLPFEWEWQWAAAGEQNRAYPFGEWQEGYCNSAESGLNRSIAVGMYPQNQALCGAMDLAGNVWEWCLNDYEIIRHVDYNNEAKKVRRGGSFNFPKSFLHNQNRDIVHPHTRSSFNGMRLVLAEQDKGKGYSRNERTKFKQ